MKSKGRKENGNKMSDRLKIKYFPTKLRTCSSDISAKILLPKNLNKAETSELTIASSPEVS